jgi:hypothetical protein
LLRIAPSLAGTCLLAVFGAAVVLPGTAAAATKPQLKLSTKTLTLTKQAKLTGSHLKPKAVYTVLLAQPNLKNKKLVGLIGGGMTDAKGNLSIKVQAPAKTACGAATLYAYTTKSKTMITLKVTVSGCNAPIPTSAPPPPPAKPSPTPKH